MSRRQFIADEISGDRAALTGAHAAHLTRVLRAKVGQQFEIAVPDGVRVGRIVFVEPQRIEFELGEEVPSKIIAQATLYLAVIRFERMDWAVEKCTELGAARIVPLIAERTEISLARAAEKRVARWRRLALQASEQSRRASPPEIAVPAKLEAALGTPENHRVVLSERERRTNFSNVIADFTGEWVIALAVGPEGGWTDRELERFREAEWTSASLGPRIWRTETAAMAAMAMVAAV